MIWHGSITNVKIIKNWTFINGTGYMYCMSYCRDYSLALHPNKELIASGQVAGHAKKEGKVRKT